MLARGVRRTSDVVAVVVLVAVDGERARSTLAEKPCIGRMLRDGLGDAGAADVMVEADDAIAPRHDDVEVV